MVVYIRIMQTHENSIEHSPERGVQNWIICTKYWLGGILYWNLAPGAQSIWGKTGGNSGQNKGIGLYTRGQMMSSTSPACSQALSIISGSMFRLMPVTLRVSRTNVG